jgi:hypothetical protein
MGDVLWSARNGDTTTEIRLEGESIQMDQDTFSTGPVAVVEVAADVERQLGGAQSVIEAFRLWPQLLTFGTRTVCAWAGHVDELDDTLGEDVRLAPPEHWAGSAIECDQLDVPVNDGFWSASLHNLAWENVATVASEWGAWSVSVFDGWSWTSSNDTDEAQFEWVGLDTFPDTEVISLVGNPPNWPRGDDLEVHVASESPEFTQQLAELLASSEATEIYRTIRLNDVVIFRQGDPSGDPG